jgi:hypothetical protein
MGRCHCWRPVRSGVRAINLDHLKPIDTKDDRYQIFFALQFLTECQRVEFLRWAVDHVNATEPPLGQMKITSASGEVAETYWDLCLLIAQKGLDLNVTLRELERRAGMKPLAFGV